MIIRRKSSGDGVHAEPKEEAEFENVESHRIYVGVRSMLSI
jgi:hypothetical protein